MTQKKEDSKSLEKMHRDMVSNKPSSLVKRALDDLARLKAQPPSGPEHLRDLPPKRQIRVVIGNFEKNVNDLYSEEIKEVIKDKYALTITAVSYGDELLEIAVNNAADILIVIVNNIYIRPLNPPEERIEKSIQLITQIKKAFHKPMIVVYIPTETEFMRRVPYGITEERVKQIGADFNIRMSADTTDFLAAFEKCMNDVLRRAS